ncbi:hypothetical protein TcCL_NonESM11939, partial [Trypanosoma cruzi]
MDRGHKKRLTHTVLVRANNNNKVVRTKGSPKHPARYGPHPCGTAVTAHTLQEDVGTPPLTRTQKKSKFAAATATRMDHKSYTPQQRCIAVITHTTEKSATCILYGKYLRCAWKKCRDAAFHVAFAIHISLGSTQPPLLRSAPRAARVAPLKEVVTAHPHHRALRNTNLPHG